MQTQVVEVDEGVFQVVTQWSDGSITVDVFHGRDAYDQHMQGEMHGQRTEGLGNGRVAGTSDTTRLRHRQARRDYWSSRYWQDHYHEAGVPVLH